MSRLAAIRLEAFSKDDLILQPEDEKNLQLRHLRLGISAVDHLCAMSTFFPSTTTMTSELHSGMSSLAIFVLVVAILMYVDKNISLYHLC